MLPLGSPLTGTLRRPSGKEGTSVMSDNKTALVISAHSADFVWRAGGAIALHQAKGYAVTVVCLSYGERGESAKLWKQEGMSLDKVKTERRKEAENAAAALGVNDIRFFDVGDYPLRSGTRDSETAWSM